MHDNVHSDAYTFFHYLYLFSNKEGRFGNFETAFLVFYETFL
nr:MAG TPA: hypothetical protein [Bacteriophage sp.]